MGAFSSAFFSALLGIVGCAKLLQAIARYDMKAIPANIQRQSFRHSASVLTGHGA
jgi:hypothetical protein